MKISLLQIVLSMLFVSASFAHTSNAQELLNKKVTLHLKAVEVEKVILKLEKSVGVNFMYSPELIQSKRKISVEASDRPLSIVLSEIFGPLNIRYEVFGEQILLKRLQTGSSNAKEESMQEVEILERNVSGVITDDKKEPVPGVSVQIKGTTRGVVSDVNGQYKITVPNEKAVLVFTSVGYLKKEVEVGNQSIIDIVLQTDNKSLDEVVVVGYGTVKKGDLTGAVTTISSKDFKIR
ncbi:carboxypeptidase-like regulatory domain-containing protein [Pseudarcicella hirudinis]|uniref:carboxypeptidase-like regulatory domain-containing protein n=1 Tax=Pseudarcicella hirudinis TaxID=1079859 RepID=UPI0035E7E25C